MTLSLHQASVTVYLRLLNQLSATLDKAAAHAEAGKIEPSALLDARLFPDMWPFSRQVQAATNHAFRGVARLAGLPIPEITDAAASFDDLKQRVAETLAFIESADPAAVDAGADREITFPLGSRQATLSGTDYFLHFSLPNFYFHLTTAYNILRTNGVPLVKDDFVGRTE
ncbi:DUF1993 domain-containing protein [Bauldia litoralis]|uniref:DUF1993 domain-containing protein n=1 Tax=Bauldia litoralis TaxID=665467 RepID=A0A1G6D245_9HYPH|nr:DUF1993 domain-containing protein [Bauldia litoralis]SDB39141.1 hypothetical protein SAMN02982931_02904 [Bauldia litoralis]